MLKRWIILVLISVFAFPFSSIGDKNRPLPKDIMGEVIQGITSIDKIQNVSIAAEDPYVAVTIPPENTCKSIFIKTRAGNAWRMATSAAPTSYVLVDFNLAMSIVGNSNAILFYVRADSVADILEIVYMD